ncbi:hypothetical protein RHMOL_Rhmol02G0178800 [Rhododendron molle]|uniref:Uncharacterized protein n=1 Tax=Rhododendron molle TaxID=49168 RepID=A0ACC0PRH1_RHOML|nr:hypothetical protein RHMOL_Rhmol02G0178800 [Rhododendron molle]
MLASSLVLADLCPWAGPLSSALQDKLRVTRNRIRVILPGRAFHLLSDEHSKEIARAKEYPIHSFRLLVTPESLAKYFLGPRVIEEEEHMAPRPDKAMLARLKAARGNLVAGQAVLKRKKKEHNMSAFVEIVMSDLPSPPRAN